MKFLVATWSQNELSALGTADVWVPILFLAIIFIVIIVTGYRGGWKRALYFSLGNLFFYGLSALIWLGVKDTLTAAVVAAMDLTGAESLFAQVLGLVWLIIYMVIGNIILESIWAFKLKRKWGKLSPEQYDEVKLAKYELKKAKVEARINKTNEGSWNLNSLKETMNNGATNTNAFFKKSVEKDTYINLFSKAKTNMGDVKKTFSNNILEIQANKRNGMKQVLNSRGKFVGAFFAVILSLPLFMIATGISLGLMSDKSKINNDVFASAIYQANDDNFNNVSYFENPVTFIPAVGSTLAFTNYFFDKQAIIYDEDDIQDSIVVGPTYDEKGGVSFYEAFRFAIGGIGSNGLIDKAEAAVGIDPHAWADIHRSISNLWGNFNPMFENIFNSESGGTLLGVLMYQGYVANGYIAPGWNEVDDWYYDGTDGAHNPEPMDSTNVILGMINNVGFPGIADDKGAMIKNTSRKYQKDNLNNAKATKDNWKAMLSATENILKVIDKSIKDDPTTKKIDETKTVWDPSAANAGAGYGTVDGQNIFNPVVSKGRGPSKTFSYLEEPIQGSSNPNAKLNDDGNIIDDKGKEITETMHGGLTPDIRVDLYTQNTVNMLMSIFMFDLLDTKIKTIYDAKDQDAAVDDPNAIVIHGGLHDASSKSVKKINEQIWNSDTNKYENKSISRNTVDFDGDSDTVVKGWDYMPMWNSYKKQLMNDKNNGRNPSPMPQALLSAITRNNMVTGLYATYNLMETTFDVDSSIDMTAFAKYAYEQGKTQYDYTNVVNDISEMLNDIFTNKIWDFGSLA